MGALRLAFREMTRRAGRFAVLAGAVTVLVFFLLFQQGLLSGLITEFVGAIRNQDADVLVYSDQARQNLQASVVPPAFVEQAASVEGVAATGPLGVGTFTVDLESGGTDPGGPGTAERTDAAIFGYEPGHPGGPARLAAGRLPQAPGEAVVSANAGAGWDLGDTLTVVPGGPGITIVGTAEEISFSVLPTLFVPFDTYVDARRAQNPDAREVPPSAVAVEVTSGTDAGAVTDALEASLVGSDPLTRAEAEAQAPGVSAVRQSFSVILLLGYVVVAVVVGFFFLILTAQKADQLTLLRALGVSGGRLVAVVLAQVAVVVTVALVLGAALALVALSSGSSGIDAGLAPAELAGASALVALLALVAATGAVRRIRRLDPARAVDLEAAL